jgi:arginase
MTHAVPREIGVLSVALDLGAGRRGTDMGPSAIRLAGLARRLARLDVTLHDRGNVGAPAFERRPTGDEKLRFGHEIQHTCVRLRDRVRKILADGAIPLVLGGDHSIAMGTVSGVAAHLAASGEKLGLLWIDAHADMNTADTTPSGNVHGMPLAMLLGRGDELLLSIGETRPVIASEHTVILGLRDVDAGEADRIRRLGVTVYTMTDLDERGIAPCVREGLDRVTAGTAGFHLSFDMDALDPLVAPGVGTPVPGGLTYREAHLACELIAQTEALRSLEFVEVNPILDERNRTGELAVELIQSALGKTILR